MYDLVESFLPIGFVKLSLHFPRSYGSQASGDGGKSVPSNDNYIKLINFTRQGRFDLARLPVCVANDS